MSFNKVLEYFDLLKWWYSTSVYNQEQWSYNKSVTCDFFKKDWYK